MTGLSLLMLLAQSAVTPVPASAPAATAAPQRVVYVMDVEEGKLVCRLESEATSRIKFRVCRTELQWEEIARETQQDLQSSRMRRTCGSQVRC